MSRHIRGAAQPLTTERLLALIRVSLLPVVLVGERLVPYRGTDDAVFLPVFALAAGYASITAWVAWRRPGRDSVPMWQLTLDVLFLCALAYSSGGPLSQVRSGFFAVPVAAALLARPRVTAAASFIAVAAYLAIAVLHPASKLAQAPGVEGAQVAYLLWAGLAATLVSIALARRASEADALAASRGRLVAQMLDAEDHHRRELAEALHDEAIQNLLAARQELAPDRLDEADLARVRLGLDRTVAQLRGAVFELHPYLLEHAGLGPALAAVAEDSARRGSFVPDIDVDTAVGRPHNQLLFSVGRELIRNVARHAEADHLQLSVRLEGDTAVMVAEDDGRGFDPARLATAPMRGHIGLASMAERVEALGGSFSIDSAAGVGTRVEVRIPLDSAGRPPGRPRDATAPA